MSIKLSINEERFLSRLKELGQTGREGDKLTRLAASDTDKAGRDAVVAWMKDAGLEVKIDRIGNLFGIWSNRENEGQSPVMTGSHIDTVINAGIYDGCYGVIAGIEVIDALRSNGFVPSRPIVVGVFTNEEGVRYAPDMMGSLVYAGDLSADEALSTVGTDGTVLGEELKRIGYYGSEEPGFLKPHSFIELHIEQGPILDSMKMPVGAVENLQGISWQRITIEGVANHAGTTPMAMRKDAGHAAAKVISFVCDRASSSNSVATVGCIEFEPNAINVIPSKAVFTVDLRNPNDETLKKEEAALADYLKEIEVSKNVKISTERLVRFEPVIFDESIVKLVEDAARQHNLPCRRITSGAGQDAQMMARICPTAMIFVPSVDGISHNSKEFTLGPDLVAGANVLMNVIVKLAESE
ncbi:MAG: Zn-dependent hydrolase [Sedimentibacter sp.]|uniref:Zn-dependent hydrolase n=1 Tax=Sedimentibacter sp. TaxID=1960295 RepID=UPI003158C762